MANKEQEKGSSSEEDVSSIMVKYLPKTEEGRRLFGRAIGELASGKPDRISQGFRDLLESFKGCPPETLGTVYKVAGQLVEEFAPKLPNQQRPN